MVELTADSFRQQKEELQSYKNLPDRDEVLVAQKEVALARTLTLFSAELCEKTKIDEPYKCAYVLCKRALGRMKPHLAYRKPRAEAYIIQAETLWFQESPQYSRCITLYDRGLELLAAIERECPSDPGEYESDSKWASSWIPVIRRSRALVLHRSLRYQDSIAELQQLQYNALYNKNPTELLGVLLALSDVLSDSGRIRDAISVLDKVKLWPDRMVTTPNHKLRLHSSRSNVYYRQGDYKKALQEAYIAMHIYFENAKALNMHANIVLRVIRFRIELGDTEEAGSLLDIYRKLNPHASGNMVKLNDLVLGAQHRITIGDLKKAKEQLIAIKEIMDLAKANNEIAKEYDLTYHVLMSELIGAESSQAAAKYIFTKTGIRELSTDSIASEEYPLLLIYCEYQVRCGDVTHLLPHLQLLVNCSVIANRLTRWRVPAVVAEYYAVSGDFYSALHWVWVALSETQCLNIPLLGSSERRYKNIRQVHKVWERAEQLTARIGYIATALKLNQYRNNVERSMLLGAQPEIGNQFKEDWLELASPPQSMLWQTWDSELHLATEYRETGKALGDSLVDITLRNPSSSESLGSLHHEVPAYITRVECGLSLLAYSIENDELIIRVQSDNGYMERPVAASVQYIT